MPRLAIVSDREAGQRAARGREHDMFATTASGMIMTTAPVSPIKRDRANDHDQGHNRYRDCHNDHGARVDGGGPRPRFPTNPNLRPWSRPHP
jgi:hypothetical protein